MTMQTHDSIIGFAIAHAIQQRTDLVKADMIKLMRRQAELEDENLELRRLVGLLRVAKSLGTDVDQIGLWGPVDVRHRTARAILEPRDLFPGVGSVPKPQ